MFNFNNTHIFTGYLKQLLASFNLPTCKVYTHEFARHVENYHEDDPRIVKSFDSLSDGASNRMAVRVNYLLDHRLGNLFYDRETKHSYWRFSDVLVYNEDKYIPGLTRKLVSPGPRYDTETHEYLGDYLRFMRDYYDINLMPLYNCFNDKICTNIYFTTDINRPAYNGLSTDEETHWHLNTASGVKATEQMLGLTGSGFDPLEDGEIFVDITTKRWAIRQRGRTFVTQLASRTVTFDSLDPNYKIYAIPVKLFENYTIAIDCAPGFEVFCGLYKTSIESSAKALDLFSRTYKKFNNTIFSQPVLFDGLSVETWPDETATELLDINKMCRCDIINREQDLRLFIKIPVSCKSTITILEGDYRSYNDTKYDLTARTYDNTLEETWKYKQNHTVLNFEYEGSKLDREAEQKTLNESGFKPISKLQLLAFNTHESYPFSDRLVEYLSGSAITSADEIADNIRRVQKVMNQNQHYFKIDGVWENKIQKIAYDYVINSGPIVLSPTADQLIDRRQGLHPTVGHVSKSRMYDTLGYIDKDVEKYYASWAIFDKKLRATDRIQTADVYDGLFDI